MILEMRPMFCSANEHPGDDYLIKGSIPCEPRQRPDRRDSLSARCNNYIVDGAGRLSTVLIIVNVCGDRFKEEDGETPRMVERRERVNTP